VFTADALHQFRLQQSRLDRLQPAVERLEELRAQRRELSEQIKTVRAAEATLRQTIGDRVCWAAGLADMSRAVPSGVTLVEVAGVIEQRSAEREGGPLLSVKGFSPITTGAQQSDPADSFAEGLRRSQVLAGVEFSSSRVLQSDDGGTRQFILSATPLVVPGKLAIGVSQ
jgi:Tfp pilus assembly protein PilN